MNTAHKIICTDKSMPEMSRKLTKSEKRNVSLPISPEWLNTPNMSR